MAAMLLSISIVVAIILLHAPLYGFRRVRCMIWTDLG